MAQIEDVTCLGACKGRETSSEEYTARAYNSTNVDGNLHAAVRRLTVREGRVMSPHGTCTKTGIPMLKVLQNKHPGRRIPNLGSVYNLAFEDYPCMPQPVPVQCDIFDMENIAK